MYGIEEAKEARDRVRTPEMQNPAVKCDSILIFFTCLLTFVVLCIASCYKRSKSALHFFELAVREIPSSHAKPGGPQKRRWLLLPELLINYESGWHIPRSTGHLLLSLQSTCILVVPLIAQIIHDFSLYRSLLSPLAHDLRIKRSDPRRGDKVGLGLGSGVVAEIGIGIGIGRGLGLGLGLGRVPEELSAASAIATRLVRQLPAEGKKDSMCDKSDKSDKSEPNGNLSREGSMGSQSTRGDQPCEDQQATDGAEKCDNRCTSSSSNQHKQLLESNPETEKNAESSNVTLFPTNSP
jgi:hypothetical protein